MEINWNDPKSLVSANISVHECTFLPTWGIYHIPNDEQKQNLINTCAKLELIRTYLGDHPINVNCMIRPRSVNCKEDRYSGKNYNMAVGGASGSAHITGQACDFTVSTITCNDVRSELESQLEAFGIRMEKKNNAGWCHIDTFSPNPNRYFIP